MRLECFVNQEREFIVAENIIGDVFNEAGRQVKFGKDIGIICPVCGKNNMHVRAVIENTATIECPSCGYIENKPAEFVTQAHDLHGRPLIMPK